MPVVCAVVLHVSVCAKVWCFRNAGISVGIRDASTRACGKLRNKISAVLTFVGDCGETIAVASAMIPLLVLTAKFRKWSRDTTPPWRLRS